MLDEVPDEGDPLKIQGSAMVALASSKEEVMEMLKKDIYAKSEVWDFSKACFNVMRKRELANFQIDSDLSVQVCFPPPIIASVYCMTRDSLENDMHASIG